MSEEALREAVLLETLARLLREKMGTTGNSARSVSSTIPPWRREQAESTPQVPEANTEDKEREVEPEREEKVEAPLEKFIRVFGLDELASKCLLKLQDDEAAFVIESCQHRLKYAKNPSAVVMIAIRGVAAKVGRRYYGTRETAEGDETQVVGELKMIGGSPEHDLGDVEVAQTDPYLSMVEGEAEGEEEEDIVVDQEVDASNSAGAPALKRPRIEPEQPLPKERSAEVPLADAAQDREDGQDTLFFVDTGGA